jgi:hypothetical protein
MEKIVTRVNTVWLGEDGIFRIIHVPGAELTLEDAKESMAAYLKLNKGKRRPLFIDIKNLKSFTLEARKYYAGEEAARAASASALVVGSHVSRVLGNFYLGISKPIFPTRIFSSEDEALEWLKGHIE